MNLQILFIYAVGAVVVLTMLRYIITAQAILGMNLKPPEFYLVERDNLPEYLRELYETKEKELLEMGFLYSHSRVLETLVVRIHYKQHYFFFYHSETGSYATLTTAS